MSDDRQEPPAGDADATRPLPPGHAGTGDATRPLPPTTSTPRDATRPMPRADGAAAGPRPSGATAPQEAPATGGLPPTPAAWSGRAGVPSRPAGQPEPEWYAEEQAGRRWWMPILLGILALLLLALIGLGVWLALRAVEQDQGPLPSPSAVPSTVPQTSAAPATTPPTTSPPTTPPAPTPAELAMPPLVGLPAVTARTILDRLGVDYRVETRASDRPAGTVIETDPAAGEPIREGDRVTLVVAGPSTPTTGADTPTSGPTVTATP